MFRDNREKSRNSRIRLSNSNGEIEQNYGTNAHNKTGHSPHQAIEFIE